MPIPELDRQINIPPEQMDHYIDPTPVVIGSPEFSSPITYTTETKPFVNEKVNTPEDEAIMERFDIFDGEEVCTSYSDFPAKFAGASALLLTNTEVPVIMGEENDLDPSRLYTHNLPKPAEKTGYFWAIYMNDETYTTRNVECIARPTAVTVGEFNVSEDQAERTKKGLAALGLAGIGLTAAIITDRKRIK